MVLILYSINIITKVNFIILIVLISIGGVMIEKIIISPVASYKTRVEINDLKKVNYFYGENGAGKTTISRIIANPDSYSACSIQWLNDIPLDTLVYNQDFVENNFNQNTSVKGVFTLGDQQVKAEQEIAELNSEIEKYDRKAVRIKNQLEGNDSEQIRGKHAELADLRPWLEEKCWVQKQKLDEYFKEAFKGLRDSKKKFCEKVLAENDSNHAEVLELEVLKEKAKTIFNSSIEKISLIPNISNFNFSDIENNPLLKKVIVGDQDVEISKLIEHLGNSDWVKKGLEYYDDEQKICPFCQQQTSESLLHDFQSFFNKEYQENIAALQTLKSRYVTSSDGLLSDLNNSLSYSNGYLDEDIFKGKVELLKERTAKNIQLLKDKISEPSIKISLDQISEEILGLSTMIKEANQRITEHNSTVDNIDKEKELLVSQVWKYVINELQLDLNKYNSDKERLENTIDGLKKSLRNIDNQKKKLNADITEWEKRITSIAPTKDAINELLGKFGFTSFFIDVSDDGKHYKICRNDGRDASKTLSEGEKTFITFLYFYYLIKGAQTSTGITGNRIVVFDDPISSLDSNVLYIVSTLIKEVVKETENSASSIKQVFILTHNVYFHKEVTFSHKREKEKVLKNESFWMVSKGSNGTTISSCDQNPIQSAYELLWQDIKLPTISNISLQNTMRRILENYFTMWGGMGKDEICDLFQGRDKLICNSLFSWVNDGSHSINDDLYIDHGNQTNEIYLAVFEKIFEKANQKGHYNMMMDIKQE